MRGRPKLQRVGARSHANALSAGAAAREFAGESSCLGRGDARTRREKPSFAMRCRALARQVDPGYPLVRNPEIQILVRRALHKNKEESVPTWRAILAPSASEIAPHSTKIQGVVGQLRFASALLRSIESILLAGAAYVRHGNIKSRPDT